MDTVFPTWGSFPCSDQSHLSWKVPHWLQTYLEVSDFTWEAEVRNLNKFSKNCKGRVGEGEGSICCFHLLGQSWFLCHISHLGFIKAIFISLSFPVSSGMFPLLWQLLRVPQGRWKHDLLFKLCPLIDLLSEKCQQQPGSLPTKAL